MSSASGEPCARWLGSAPRLAYSTRGLGMHYRHPAEFLNDSTRSSPPAKTIVSLAIGSAINGASVDHLERWAILRPRAAMIVDPRGGDVGVPEPLLHLGDVGLVIEGVGSGRRAQRMRADLEPKLA
jgi:hypothetical protein